LKEKKMMYPLIDLWPFPNIPGPSDWFKSLAGMFFDSQIGMLKFAMSLIFGTSKATQQVLESDWFSYRLGGWTNLGLDLFPLAVICVTAFVIIRYRAHSPNHAARLIRALIVLALFVRLYYPAVGFIYQAQQETYAVIAQHFAGGDLNNLVDDLAKLANPLDVVGMFFGAIIGWFIALFLVTVSLYLFVATLGVSLLYPVIVALSPIGSINGFFARVFHWSNAMLMTVIFSPILMIFWLAVAIGGTAQARDWFPVGSSYIGIGLEDVALLLCIATPIAIMWLSYHGSLEVFGQMDSRLRNAVDIRSSAPLSVREAEDRPDHNHRSMLRQAVTVAAVSSLDDQPKQPMSQRLADMAAMGAMAVGQPEAAAVAKAVGGQLQRKQAAKARATAQAASKTTSTPKGGAT
jgi:hypothetical protein